MLTVTFLCPSCGHCHKTMTPIEPPKTVFAHIPMTVLCDKCKAPANRGLLIAYSFLTVQRYAA